MASWLEKLRDFFSDDLYQPEQQEKVEKPQKEEKKQQQKRKIYTFDDLEFDYDNYSVRAGRGVHITSFLRFDNGYNMYVSLVNFANEDFLYSKEDFLKHNYLGGYEITIEDSKHCQNNTCLNEDGKSILAYSKKDVTNVMKLIQQIDENGQLPKVDIRTKIEARKNHIKKARALRKSLEKREGSVSGVIIADNIAEKIISGEEKRKITPDVAEEYKRKALRGK
jgi:hypothetical protein